MDAKSAFDVVVHSNLMRKLYNTGIEPNEWMLINSLHQDSVTAVKWRNKLSSTYINQQGYVKEVCSVPTCINSITMLSYIEYKRLVKVLELVVLNYKLQHVLMT